ncbi:MULTISPECIES: helix-turn-helix transcriptional regulator [Paraliobacillus]|uniref:helix-turn-helix transcriptional regulator n=1 Tax=Paraliobacillus TaxID=200903 RepID=UPI000DD441C1|nr:MULTISPECIES: AraC family transcriptional regulator [Paraliobacillus]
MLPNQEHLEYICEILSLSYDLPAFILNKEGVIQFESGSNFVKHPLIQSKTELFHQLTDQNDSCEFPIFRITIYLENFISVALKDSHGYYGAILIGPIIDSRLIEEMIEGLVSDLKVPSYKKESVFKYYRELPNMSKMKIAYLSLHLYYMLYKRRLDPVDVIEKNRSINKKIVEIEDPNYSVSKRRQDVRLHHDLLYEQKVLQCVVEGNKVGVIKYWRSNDEEGDLGVLSKKSHLRHLKNLGISAITLATRAAMKGGINHEVAYTLSDLYIQNIEDIDTSKNVELFIEHTLGDFAERVRKNKQQKYSRPVNFCLNYIFNHLYDEISLDILANVSGVHPNYLSAIFRKEVGTTMKNYILNTKIEEAKTLIQFTEYSLLKISTLLNFYDQSYFTKIFKRFVGVTPYQYKNNLK